MSTAALADILAGIRELQEYCCDTDLKMARQHIEAALDYIRKGQGERAQRRVACAHVALQHILEVHTRDDAPAKAYLRAMILGEGDADALMAQLVREAVAEAEEAVA